MDAGTEVVGAKGNQYLFLNWLGLVSQYVASDHYVSAVSDRYSPCHYRLSDRIQEEMCYTVMY